ncbi:cation:proton antiporter [Kordiimonas sp. SCSIO 12603]|uniref:cation:proton antiporter family protein n=1 Tax=Kordiimonas sp. SCSIO 12603 TaxID=2829596 RepID=UPI002104B0FC|nr:cation:proton antiporter family protein [Kordiimonas sp. SCSIO 12603]UTW59229.1 cation:proton antiporter [Kordiimonas sp. SCSIO 12603]
MDFQWVAIALGDVAWISLAFILGLLSRSVGLPPLVGYLATGFLLNIYGIASGEMLEKLADLGITLLLFTVGLKLNLRVLARPQVWAVTSLHTAIVVVVFGFSIYALALAGVPFLSDLSLSHALLIAFALSFSSTVFVVKVLEERGEVASLHGQIAVGILIMQDIAAVAFLAISTGKWPSVWAALIVLLIPLRFVLHRLLQYVGHGELLVLYGFMLAMGGAELFELVGMKGDLGALALGLLIASHPKADEMAKTMLGFKDLFLLGFFLAVGLSGQPTLVAVTAGVLLAPLVFFKSALFFALLTRFRLRARTSLLASVNLTNFSEFGLIVAAIGVGNGWLDSQWLIAIATALSLSFAIAAALTTISRRIYRQKQSFWKSLQKDELIADDQPLDTKGATIAVIGMGGVGTGAYNTMRDKYGDTVIGIDIDPVTAKNHRKAGRNVLHGDSSDADFWDRIQADHSLELVMLAMPKFTTNLAVLEQLKQVSFEGRVAATAKFSDEATALKQAGADTVFNIYTEAGAGFAGHVVAQKAES